MKNKTRTAKQITEATETALQADLSFLRKEGPHAPTGADWYRLQAQVENWAHGKIMLWRSLVDGWTCQDDELRLRAIQAAIQNESYEPQSGSSI